MLKKIKKTDLTVSYIEDEDKQWSAKEKELWWEKNLLGREITNEVSKLFLLDRIEIANAIFSFSDVSPERKPKQNISYLTMSPVDFQKRSQQWIKLGSDLIRYQS